MVSVNITISDGVNRHIFYNIPKRLAKAIILLLNYCENGGENIISSVEEERKTGEWTKNNSCPFCGFLPWYESDIHTLSFCPNCGSDMRGIKNEI